MKNGSIKMTAKDGNRTILVVCRLINKNPEALYMEWRGDLDTVTTLCKDKWGEGILRRVNEILFYWKSDEGDGNATHN